MKYNASMFSVSRQNPKEAADERRAEVLAISGAMEFLKHGLRHASIAGATKSIDQLRMLRKENFSGARKILNRILRTGNLSVVEENAIRSLRDSIGVFRRTITREDNSVYAQLRSENTK